MCVFLFSDTIFKGKDGTEWLKNPPRLLQRRAAHTIFREQRVGATRETVGLSLADIFCEIFDSDIQAMICRYTNQKANAFYSAWNTANPTKREHKWTELTETEFISYCGLLLVIGGFRSNSVRISDLWNSNAFPLYRATMAVKRFKEISRFLRFDNGDTRLERLVDDKAAAISDLFERVNANLLRLYVPSENLTVDEQLYAYRGRTRFTQYIPSKPAKYGIKVWWVCDAKSFYPLKGQIYTGKINNQRDVNQGERVVKQLVQPFENTGRTITTDNFFTSLALAEDLMRKKLSLIGTLKKNRKFVPAEFRQSKDREVLSTEFGFRKNAMICSYVPKQNKSVLLLSTKHRTNAIVGDQKKPEVIHFYNQTKAGVDTMDKMLGTYSVKRKTNRWPQSFFFNILDVAALAAYIIYCDHNPSQNFAIRDSRRRILITQMGQDMCYPTIQNRAAKPLSIRNFSIKNAIECIMGMPISEINEQNPNDSLVAVEGEDINGRQRHKGNCHICKSESQSRRSSRRACVKCKKAVCKEHSLEFIKCQYCCLN